MIIRRLIAVVGILALAVAYLPGVVDGSSFDANVPTCCNGIMCPMHHMTDNHVYCDMDGNHKESAFQSCPDYGIHYAAALTFVRVASAAFITEQVVELAPAFALHFAPAAYLGVMSPPPRTSLV